MGALPDTKVMVQVRDSSDPDFPVPVQIHCPQCPGWALLQQFLIGYGYICQMCSEAIPIETGQPFQVCQHCQEPLQPSEAHLHFAPPPVTSGDSAAGK